LLHRTVSPSQDSGNDGQFQVTTEDLCLCLHRPFLSIQKGL